MYQKLFEQTSFYFPSILTFSIVIHKRSFSLFAFFSMCGNRSSLVIDLCAVVDFSHSFVCNFTLKQLFSSRKSGSRMDFWRLLFKSGYKKS